MKNGKKTFSFTLVLSPSFSELNEEVETAIYEAGCSDALLGMRDGIPFLDFDRKAPTFEEAVLSAIRDVKKAGFEVHHVEPDDLVSASEIARRTGKTRQAVHQRIARGFPPPASSLKGTIPLWRWSDVVEVYGEEESAHSRTVAAVNNLLGLNHSKLDGRVVQKLWKHLKPEWAASRGRK